MDIFDKLPTKKVKKGTIILFKGDTCQYGYMVKSGCLRSYVIDKSGKEHILQFAPEGWLISDIDSLMNHKKATIFIDAIEDSEIIMLHRSALENIDTLERADLIEHNTKLAKNIIATNRRLALLLSATAEERYLDFIDTYPKLVQRLPLKLIASYVGMTPEYLSEIRKKIAKK
jgi:CRP-like cAMP-binding protein